MERAARWDGACLYKITNDDMTPDDVRAMKAFIQDRRDSSASFDLSVGGRQRGEDWEQERALIRSLAEAGATWWTEYIPPEIGGLDVVRACVERGPLRMD